MKNISVAEKASLDVPSRKFWSGSNAIAEGPTVPWGVKERLARLRSMRRRAVFAKFTNSEDTEGAFCRAVSWPSNVSVYFRTHPTTRRMQSTSLNPLISSYGLALMAVKDANAEKPMSSFNIERWTA